MNRSRVQQWLALPLLLVFIFSLISPAVVSAAELDSGEPVAVVLMQDDAEVDAEVGTAVALSTIFFVLFLVAIVAILGAAAMGIIGLGAWMGAGDE